MKVDNTELIIKASILEEGLVDEVKQMILKNPRLFAGEKVVLMADAHKGSGVPVGFTMTLSNGLIPVDYVSADMFCGVTGLIVKNYVPSSKDLEKLKVLARDMLQVNRRFDLFENRLTDKGTLGNGNHFVEVGTNGKDTLISVHSGSRGYGGNMYKNHKQIAKEHTKDYYHKKRVKALENIEPQKRQEYLKSLPQPSNLALLDTRLYEDYWDDLADVSIFANRNRQMLIDAVLAILRIELSDFEVVESVHNYVDISGDVPIIRKGSISAKNGDRVIIPINMRDGIIVGTTSLTENVNYSLPHGAGRVMSRTRAFKELNINEFIDDMKDIYSTTVNESTLDESPRAYKPLDVIIEDIKPYLSEYEVFKPLFNYKGV